MITLAIRGIFILDSYQSILYKRSRFPRILTLQKELLPAGWSWGDAGHFNVSPIFLLSGAEPIEKRSSLGLGRVSRSARHNTKGEAIESFSFVKKTTEKKEGIIGADEY